MRRTAICCISLLITVAVTGSSAAGGSGARCTFRFDRISLRTSLDSLSGFYSLAIVYLDKDVDGKEVSTSCTECDFDEALDSVLTGTSLTWIRFGSQVVLKEREIAPSHPSTTVCGTVRDSATGEWISGATILLRDGGGQSSPTVLRSCPTNAFGFFSLPHVPTGTYVLAARAMGYRLAEIPLVATTEGPQQRAVSLVQEDIPFQEITVEGNRTTLASAESFTRGVYLRAVPSDQNHYLLDGARIYNPSQYGGVLSTFNAEALNDVQVEVGGLPPSYGGHVGGIVDLSMRDGSRERLSGSAGTGSLGSQLSLEGPLNTSSTFLLSGRRGYPDPAVPFLHGDGTLNRLGSSELTGKMTYRFSPRNQVSFAGYFGRNVYTNMIGDSRHGLSNDFDWGNKEVNVRWIGIASPSLFLQASGVYTRYDFTLNQLLSGDQSTNSRVLFTSDYTIDDLSCRAQAESYHDEEHTVRAGIELTHHRINAAISPFSTQTGSLSLQDFASLDAAVYLQDQWRILPGVVADIGARATSFTGDNGTFSAVDPRFSLLFSPDEGTRLYGSLTVINQFIHPYRNSGVFLLYPTMFWYPSGEHAPPSSSLQLTLGVEKALQNNTFVVSAESYYRVTNTLHEFGLDSTGSLPADLSSEILLGTGKAYGVECSLRKRTGDLNGSITYTLSWVRERVPDINNGKPFSPPFDRRHEIQVAAWYMPVENWVFGFLCVLASDQSASSVSRTVSPESGNGRGLSSGPEFVDINGGRLPGFQRIELTARYRCALLGLPSQFSLRLLNAYGLLDPVTWQLRGSSDIRLKWSAFLQAPSLMPWYPAVAFAVWF